MDEVLGRVLAVAAKQHSVVNTEQMKACGASRTWVARRAQQGIILREGPSAWRVNGVRRAFENRAMAAVLSARAPALVSHRSAAYRWRYLEFTWWDLVRSTAEVVDQVTAALGRRAA